jgi:hypothetical protein
VGCSGGFIVYGEMPVAVIETGSHRLWCFVVDTVQMYWGLAGVVVYESYATAETHFYVVSDRVRTLWQSSATGPEDRHTVLSPTQTIWS